VFTRSASGIWSQHGPKLVGTGAIGVAFQGWSVSLSGDGSTAIVGGRYDNNGVGAAWVFTRSDGVWSQQAKLVGAGALGPFPAEQGNSVSLSEDGNTAIVGGPVDNSGAGAAWVYTRSHGEWSQHAKLVGAGAVNSPSGASQGFSVSLSAGGNTAIVGGPLDNDGAGAAWTFTRSASGRWSQLGDKLVGAGAVGLAQQAGAVSLSGDGNTAIVGGNFDNDSAGAAWVYAQPVFAGTPGKASCHGQSVSALAKQYGGLNNAAAALGYPSVSALQEAIMAYCEG